MTKFRHNAAGLLHKTRQAFAVFLPAKYVGVVGDARRYEYVVTLRAIETIDFMTARRAHLPYELRPLSFQGVMAGMTGDLMFAEFITLSLYGFIR